MSFSGHCDGGPLTQEEVGAMPIAEPTSAPATGPPNPVAAPATTTSTSGPVQAPSTVDPAHQTPQGDAAQLGDAGKKALDAERQARREAEARLKELEPLAARAKEMEDAQKTEAQRLTDELAAAKASGDHANARLARIEAAVAAAPPGMDLATVHAMADRLQGATPEELAADAAAFFAQFTPPAQPSQPGQIPVEQMRPGTLPNQQAPSIADQIKAAEEAGDRDAVMRLKMRQLQDLNTK